jgi:hypothetical protein
VLRWRWRVDQVNAIAILAACKAAPTLRHAVSAVAECYKRKPYKAPYLFALDVDLYHFTPKKTTLRLLHELGLIEQG